MPDSLIPATTPQQRSIIARGGAVIGAIVVLAVALPVIYYAFLSALGILGLGITAMVGFGLIQALPLLGQKLENRLLSARKAEARSHPIEQMQNRLIAKGKQLDDFKSAVSNIGGQIEGLKRMIADRHRQDPTHDLSEMQASINKMVAFYESMKVKLAAANDAFRAMKQEIDRKMFEYGFAQAGQAALKTINGTDADNMMQDLLADEAFKSVEQQFDATFAALDIETLNINSNKQLDFGKGITLDVSSIDITPVQAGHLLPRSAA